VEPRSGHSADGTIWRPEVWRDLFIISVVLVSLSLAKACSRMSVRLATLPILSLHLQSATVCIAPASNSHRLQTSVPRRYHDTKSSTPTWVEEHSWVPPTDTVEMNYTEWRQANLHARTEAEAEAEAEATGTGPQDGHPCHYYYGMATVPNTYTHHDRASPGSGSTGQQFRFGFLADALPSMTKDGAPPLLAPSPNKL
jgi:hypothetical protein